MISTTSFVKTKRSGQEVQRQDKCQDHLEAIIELLGIAAKIVVDQKLLLDLRFTDMATGLNTLGHVLFSERSITGL